LIFQKLVTPDVQKGRQPVSMTPMPADPPTPMKAKRIAEISFALITNFCKGRKKL
jgi:hypothetical protein